MCEIWYQTVPDFPKTLFTSMSEAFSDRSVSGRCSYTGSNTFFLVTELVIVREGERLSFGIPYTGSCIERVDRTARERRQRRSLNRRSRLFGNRLERAGQDEWASHAQTGWSTSSCSCIVPAWLVGYAVVLSLDNVSTRRRRPPIRAERAQSSAVSIRRLRRRHAIP